MSRNKGTQASVRTPETDPANMTSLTKMGTDINAIRAERDRLDALIKASKASTDGAVTGIQVDGDTLQVDIRLGDGTRKTGSGKAYLFATDGFKFTHNGRTYNVAAWYATEVAAK